MNLIILSVSSFACSSNQGLATSSNISNRAEQRTDRVQLVTTVYALEYFANGIGGDLVEVRNLTPPGVEAHDFQPSPGHMRLLRSADIIVYNGSGLEPWMDRALRGLNGDPRVVVEAAHGLAAEDGFYKRPDPHVWLDVDHALRQVERIRDAMIQVAPDGQDVFQTNAQILLDELAQLDAEYRDGIGDCRLDTFVTSHAAFGYLAERYDLVQVPISGLSPDAEPAPGTLADLTVQIERTGVNYMLAEPTANNRLSKTVAEETGTKILPLHPLESLTPEQAAGGADFMSIMRDNLGTLEIALECEP